jgi:hypothetical protein
MVFLPIKPPIDVHKAWVHQDLRRMTENARRLDEGGHLRKGMTVARAAEVLWTYSSPELYELLVVGRQKSLRPDQINFCPPTPRIADTIATEAFTGADRPTSLRLLSSRVGSFSETVQSVKELL